jgi:hypothetical protein
MEHSFYNNKKLNMGYFSEQKTEHVFLSHTHRIRTECNIGSTITKNRTWGAFNNKNLNMFFLIHTQTKLNAT